MVVDRSHIKYPQLPKNATKLNVIPEAVSAKSIKIIGTYKIFNITWDPVTNVNYGSVFYEVRIRWQKQDISVAEQTENVFQFPTNSSLTPFTKLEIIIRSFTYWGSSSLTRTNLSSPPGLPSEPTSPRIYTRHLSKPLEDSIYVSAIFRWSLPNHPNGEILGYKVNCYEFRRDGEKFLKENKSVTTMEQVFDGLRINDRYTFEVFAYTSVGEGNKSDQVYVDTTHEKPLPKVLVSTQEDILQVDVDRRQSKMLHGTRVPVVSMVHLAYEEKLFWFDENSDLVSYHMGQHVKTKLISAKATVKCMTIDWLERVIYWSQIDEKRGGAVIFSLNLNKAENNLKLLSVEKLTTVVLDRQNVITDLVISPFDRKLFWIENHTNLTDESGIYYLELDTKKVRMLFSDGEECMNKTSTTISPIPGTLVLATSAINPPNGDDDGDKHQSILIFGMNSQYNQQFVATKLKTKECFDFGQIIPVEGTNLAKDSNKFYWIHNDMVYAREDATNNQISHTISRKCNHLLAFYQQRYPNRNCSLPMKSRYKFLQLNATDISFWLQLPKPKVPDYCSLSRTPVKYTIQYMEARKIIAATSCLKSDFCHQIETFDHKESIEGLKPFTNYFIRVAMTSIFDSTTTPEFIATAELMTDKGKPSPPRNVTAMPLSYNEINITWLQPEIFNSDEIYYEIHWQQENIVEHIKNKQQQSLPSQNKRKTLKNDKVEERISTIIKVQPDQTYSIFIRAYSKNQTFSESESVIVKSYPEPKPLVLSSITPTSMIVMFTLPENVSSYAVQYSQYQDQGYVLSNASNIIIENKTHVFYQIDSLEPKTKYNFSIMLVFKNSDRSYHWTPLTKIEFETHGDRPSPPGRPIIEYVTEKVYKVTWNASKENGAPITKYVLESKREIHKSTFLIEKDKENRKRKRSVNGNGSEFNLDQEMNDVEIVTEMPNEIEEDIEDKWFIRYRGPESHWIVTDLHPIEQYVFRVQAVNDYGTSNWSLISEFVNSTNYKPGGGLNTARMSNVLTIIIVSISITFILLCLIYILISKYGILFVKLQRTTMIISVSRLSG